MVHLVLRVERKAYPSKTFVAPADRFSVGSSQRSDLVLGDPLIEAVHARFSCLLGNWWIEPAAPTAVVLYPRQRRLRDAEPLEPDSAIRIGPYTVVPNFDPPVRDTYAGDGEIVASNPEPARQPEAIGEDRRLRILMDVQRAAEFMSGRGLLCAFARVARALFPAASSCCLLHYAEEQFLPVSGDSAAHPDFSLSLALRCMHARRAFIWERSFASPDSRRIDSLNGVASAIYCPILLSHELRGVLVVNTTRADLTFTQSDLDLAVELCKVFSGGFRDVTIPSLAIATSFLSYSHTDGAAARSVAAFLRRQSISVWMDERLAISSDWREGLARAIAFCDAFVVLVSPETLHSEPIRWELEAAEKAGKPILPVVLRDPGETPPWLERRHYISHREGDQASLHRLSRALLGLAPGGRP